MGHAHGDLGTIDARMAQLLLGGGVEELIETLDAVEPLSALAKSKIQQWAAFNGNRVRQVRQQALGTRSSGSAWDAADAAQKKEIREVDRALGNTAAKLHGRATSSEISVAGRARGL